MSKKAQSFDSIAKFYDPLAQILFGNAIKCSQLYFLKELPEKANVLIIGGGSGWIITEIFKASPLCQLTYIEASEKMLQLSKQEAGEFSDRITFILGTEEDIPHQNHYDVLITNFLLDLFKEENLRKMMPLMSQALVEEGIWIFTDFTLTSHKRRHFWQKYLLKMMYVFFSIISGVEGRSLPDYDRLFNGVGFKQQKSRKFYWEMIESRIFRRYKTEN
jgi:tRNA (cmo5U34)-methyltransferase